MNRFFKTALTVTTAIILAVSASGCDGCNSTSPLVFNSDFAGAGATEPSFGYTETLTYDVTNASDYNTILKKSDALTDELAEYSMNGTYTSSLKLLGSLPQKSDGGEDIVTNIDVSDNTIYHLKTELNLNATYKVGGEYADGYTDSIDPDIPDGKTYNDRIVSEVFFLAAGQSFAPIWSSSKVKNSILSVSEKANVSVIEYSVITEYNSGSYKMRTVNGEEVTTDSYEYEFKRVIDTNQLLFAVRGLAINSNATKTFPVVSSSYGSAQSLVVENTAENTKTANINGKTLEIPVKNLNFKRSTQYNTGIPHYILLQKESVPDLSNKALVIEYAAPLTTYGTFTTMGALVYSLRTVSYN